MTRRVVSAIILRPADTTPYASGDLVGNSTTGSAVIPAQFDLVPGQKGGTATIKRVRIIKSGTGIVNAAFRVHLYGASPVPVTNGDNGVWLSKRAGYMGSVDVTVDKAFSDGAAGVSAGDANISTKLLKSTSKVFALLEARGAYTPGSAEQFEVILEAEVDD